MRVGYLNSYIEPWKSSLGLEFKHSLWKVYIKRMSPPTYLHIAVDKTGRAFHLNNYSDSKELFRFMHAEGLVERFAHEPERPIEIFLDLYLSYGYRLLRSLDDIEERMEGDRERIASLRDRFYPPEAIPGHPLKLDFWTWGSGGGVVARWHVEIGHGTGDIIYDKVMGFVGGLP